MSFKKYKTADELWKYAEFDQEMRSITKTFTPTVRLEAQQAYAG